MNRNLQYGWHIYTPEQIQADLDLSLLLFKEYDLLDVVGHDDISPSRKWDLGAAFPTESFRSRILGRSDAAPPIYETSRAANTRFGPWAEYPLVTKALLPAGTKLDIINAEGS